MPLIHRVMPLISRFMQLIKRLRLQINRKMWLFYCQMRWISNSVRNELSLSLSQGPKHSRSTNLIISRTPQCLSFHSYSDLPRCSIPMFGLQSLRLVEASLQTFTMCSSIFQHTCFLFQCAARRPRHRAFSSRIISWAFWFLCFYKPDFQGVLQVIIQKRAVVQ